MTRALSALVLVAVAGTAAGVSAGSSSAPMAVGVTVVRSCAIEARSAAVSPRLRLTCAAGAQSNLKISETVHPSSAAAATSDGRTVLTLNF